MNILFLSSVYPPRSRGGGEISTHLIARGLVERGHKVAVVTSAPIDEQQKEVRTVDGVTVVRLPLPLTAKPLLEQRHARKMARATKSAIAELGTYDVVHAHDFRSALVLYEMIEAGYLNARKATVTARDYAQICGSPNNLMADGSACEDCARLSCIVRNQAVVEASLARKPFRIWQYWFNIGYRRRAFLAFGTQIFISHAQHKEIAKVMDVSVQNTTVIYNPVAPDYLSVKPKNSFGQTILYTGRVQHYKGVGVLLEAFRELLKTHPDMQLRIVGDGDQRQHYEKLVASWGLQYKIRFTNHLAYERLLSLYDEAALLVAPHVWIEPFGRTVVEAMSRGRLVVVADQGGPAEVVDSGKNGFTFKTGDSHDLARVMAAVIDTGDLNRRKVQRAARDWASENLSISKIAKQYEEFYRAELIKDT